MKKLISLLLCLVMALSLAACSQSGGTDPSADASTSMEALPLSDSSADASEAAASSETAGDTSAVSDGTQTEQTTGSVSVTYETVTDSVTAEDGTTVLDISYVQPTVIVEGSEAVQTAIQADLDDWINEKLDYAYSEMKGIALETYEAQKDYGGEITGSSMQATMETRRADSSVLSIAVEVSTYAGGAHPYSTRIGLNYDMSTGERLTFDQLGDGFRAAAEEKVLAKAVEYQESEGGLFDEYADYISMVVADGTETLQSVYEKVFPDLYGESADASMASDPVEGNMEPRFLLDDTGVSFISNYEMEPYAGGILEFHVDYSDFGDTFNSAYLPG